MNNSLPDFFEAIKDERLELSPELEVHLHADWRWNLKAFVLVNVRAGKSPEVLAALRLIDAVRIAHACWGRPDIFALVEVRNERALGNLVMEEVQSIVEIESTDTHIVID